MNRKKIKTLYFGAIGPYFVKSELTPKIEQKWTFLWFLNIVFWLNLDQCQDPKTYRLFGVEIFQIIQNGLKQLFQHFSPKSQQISSFSANLLNEIQQKVTKSGKLLWKAIQNGSHFVWMAPTVLEIHHKSPQQFQQFRSFSSAVSNNFQKFPQLLSSKMIAIDLTTIYYYDWKLLFGK